MAGGSIIFILGMHRGGTSLLANVVHELDVYLGDDLVAANEFNERGYWESIEAVALHDEVLRLLDRGWGTTRASHPYPDGWWQWPDVVAVRDKLQALAVREVGRGGGTWALKDPRICRLLPLWQEIIAALDIEPIFLVSFRRPAEVAQSLLARDQCPEGIARLLWLQHYTDVVVAVGDQVADVIDYGDWFKSPKETVRRVAAALGSSDVDAAAIAARIVIPSMRHQKAEGSDGDWAEEVYELTQEWAQTRVIPPRLLATSRHFVTGSRLFHGWLDARMQQQIEVGELSLLRDENAHLHSERHEYERAHAAELTRREEYEAAYFEEVAAHEKTRTAFACRAEEAMEAYELETQAREFAEEDRVRLRVAYEEEALRREELADAHDAINLAYRAEAAARERLAREIESLAAAYQVEAKARAEYQTKHEQVQTAYQQVSADLEVFRAAHDKIAADLGVYRTAHDELRDARAGLVTEIENLRATSVVLPDWVVRSRLWRLAMRLRRRGNPMRHGNRR